MRTRIKCDTKTRKQVVDRTTMRRRIMHGRTRQTAYADKNPGRMLPEYQTDTYERGMQRSAKRVSRVGTKRGGGAWRWWLVAAGTWGSGLWGRWRRRGAPQR